MNYVSPRNRPTLKLSQRPNSHVPMRMSRIDTNPSERQLPKLANRVRLNELRKFGG
jgi:hypothetical protein